MGNPAALENPGIIPGSPKEVRFWSDFSWAHCAQPGELHDADRWEFWTVNWQLVQYGSLQTGTRVVAPDGVLTRVYETYGDSAAAAAAWCCFKADVWAATIAAALADPRPACAANEAEYPCNAAGSRELPGGINGKPWNDVGYELSPGKLDIDGFICCFTLRFELDDVNNSGDGRDEVLWVNSDFISPSLLEHRLDLWLLDEVLVDETDSEVMECEMVELFAADSVDLTGEEVDDDFDFSLDCPGEVDIDVGISLFVIVLNPGLSDVSLTGDFTLTLLLLLLLEFGLFTSGLADLSFSLSFFPILGMMFLEGDMSFPILLHVWASRANGLFFASNWN